MKPKMYNATLMRGRQYSKLISVARGDFIVFKHGVAVLVSAQIKQDLELSAVDPIQTTYSTGEIETKFVSKFEFEELDGDPGV